MLIINAIRGFCMALADSVPGVSGGTVAFLLGFYDKFISSLDDLFTGSVPKKKQALKFLVKLAIGWGIGFVLAVSILSSIFSSHIYAISSLFIGFILFAIPIVIREEKEVLKGRWLNLLFVLIGIALVVGVTMINPSSGGSDFNMSNFTFLNALYVFFAGMIAISAMVLPGISGSTLLLIFGLYVPVITAIKSLLTLDFSTLPLVLVLALGILTGVVCFIKLIRLALSRFRSQSIYTILGLMLGSLYAVFMGPTTLDVPQPPMSLSTFSIPFFLLGGVVIIGLQAFKIIMEKRSKQRLPEEADK